MMTAHDPSVEELRRESERSRAALTSTVHELREKVADTADELKTRLSPSHIKEEVKDYVRDGSEQLFRSIEQKARENPIQAVAIGAGLAYPLFGLLRSIPLPIMLVGAGLLLARQAGGGGNGSVQRMAGKVSDAGVMGASRIGEAAQGAGAALSAGAESVAGKVRGTAHDLRDSVAGMGQAAVSTAKGAAQDIRDRVSGMADDVSGMAQAAASTVKDTAAKATETVSGAASALGNKAAELGTQSRNAVEDLVERNPLLVAGVGLAIGAAIAACLPRSEAENRMFGERSDALKDRAREAVSDGVDRAKDAAAGLAGDVAAAASAHGLDADGLSKAVESVTEGAKSVVDRGLKTALGEAETPSLAPSQSQDTFQTNKT